MKGWDPLLTAGPPASYLPILGLGVACLDTIWRVPSFPAEDSKTQALDLAIQGGGPVATALVAAARLGVPSAYIGALGDDPAGSAILSGLAAEGIDISYVKTVPGARSHTAAVLVDESSGRRTVVWHPGTAPPPDPCSVPDAVLAQARFLHLDGHHPGAALPLAKRARKLGVAVSLDAGSNYPWMGDLLANVDILIGSASFARDFTGESEPEKMVAALAQNRAGIVGVTLGDAGGILAMEGRTINYPAFPVQAVDTNGAGDVFHGAFLAALVLDMDPPAAARFASAAAAMKCMVPGGREGIPGYREVEVFLAGRIPGSAKPSGYED